MKKKNAYICGCGKGKKKNTKSGIFCWFVISREVIKNVYIGFF